MNGGKRAAYLTGKIGAVSAELCEQVKRNRKNQSRHDRYRFHNGAGFEWLLRFAAVTSGWPTIRESSCGGLNRNAERGPVCGQPSLSFPARLAGKCKGESVRPRRHCRGLLQHLKRTRVFRVERK